MRSFLAIAVFMFATPAMAQVTDWGGGFSTGVDSAATTTFGATSAAQSPAKAKCNALAGFATAYAKETSARSRFAQIIDAPTSVLSAEIIPAERDLPEVCRVSGIVAPDIQFELQLPTTAWNSKFMHYGCGGMCGMVYRVQAEEPLARGYAVIASDMGHTGSPNNTAFRFNDITAMIDFSYRATHVVTLAAKEIIDEFYGNGPKYSYFMGCSTGGVQGVIEAQRYPHDFNGIIAGAPAYSTGPSYLEWGARANIDGNGNAIMDEKKLPLVRKAVIAACDKLDGTEDGLLQNPTQCKWDPSEIECKSKPGANCLTKAEADVVRKIYKGPSNSKGESVSLGYAGMARGSEYMWSPSFVAPKGEKASRLVDYNDWFGDGVFPVVAANAKRPYDYDTDPQRGNTGWGGPVFQWLRYATNPDLRRFKAAGGKLLVYHGWDDNETPPGASADYYETTSRTMGGEAPTQEFFRLFMIPGMAHCRRGPGGDAFDVITEMENWVEKGQAPERLLVHRLKKEQNYLGLPRLRYPLPADSANATRPVFPYPATAKWSGQGDITKAETWEKAAP